MAKRKSKVKTKSKAKKKAAPKKVKLDLIVRISKGVKGNVWNLYFGGGAKKVK